MTTARFAPLPPVSVVDAARAQVTELTEVLWAAKTPGDLLDVVTAIETLKSTLDAVELAVIREIEVTDAARTEDWGSTKDFVTAVTGGNRSAGAAAVRLARTLTEDCPATHAALAAGWLSRTKATVIARTVEQLPVNRALRAAAEQALLDQARGIDASDLAAFAKNLIELLDPDGDERRTEAQLARDERSAHLGRFLSITDDGAGGVRIKGRTTVEDAAIIKTTLMTLAAPAPTSPGGCGGTNSCPDPDCAHDGRDPREHGARFLDALVEACRLLQDTRVLPDAHGAKPRLTLTISYRDLIDRVGVGTTDTGESLSASAVRRLACDCAITPIVLGAHSEILDVARTQRLVTAAIWKGLVARDQHCVFPGCKRPPIACDAHHIQAWLDGGPTSLLNLCLLCRTHHTVIHNTPWQIQMNPLDQKPEFIPPARLDPTRTPTRLRYPRN